jgi:hypothetical protein
MKVPEDDGKSVVTIYRLRELDENFPARRNYVNPIQHLCGAKRKAGDRQ